jgi:N-methylhydantoinase A
LLFSFLHPAHEAELVDMLRTAGYRACASHEILPEYREYERTSTTVVNAYISPVMDRYLDNLAGNMPQGANLVVMQSNGGSISLGEARRAAVRCILSGPAGGVVGSGYIGELAANRSSGEASNQPSTSGPLKLLTFDMGGTSTDVSLIDGQPKITTEAEVGGHPIGIPILDIHTIGAGG